LSGAVSLQTLMPVLVGLAASIAATSATAGTFTISPLRLDFAGTVSTAALTVRNENAAAVVVQAQGLAWSQAGGQDALEPSRDLLISPAVFTLPAGGSQLVRVALRRNPDPSLELSYRVTLQEVPQAASPGFNGLQVALRLSLPVFVTPLEAAEPRLEWHVAREADGRLAVTATNAGTAHARVHRFTFSAVGNDSMAEQSGMAYVLPGATRRWTFDDKNNVRASGKAVAALNGAGPYRLQGTTDKGDFATELKPERD
jgi:fimbrial chaperone protein